MMILNGQKPAYGYLQVRTIFLPVLLALLTACAQQVPAVDRLGNKALPSDVKFICSEHVTHPATDASKVPISIDAQSFGTSQSVESVIRFYQPIFGTPPDLTNTGAYLWRFGDGLSYAIYPTGINWAMLKCARISPEVRAVVIVSRLSATDAH
jgi:hypothetical protein